MDWLKSFFTYQWQRKLLALTTAILIWLFVNQSITEEKTISHVPIRVINIPEDKTVPNIQPNGIIGKRLPLTLKGSKNVIDQLEPGDIEVVLDASEIQQNDWVVRITKKNLISLNPSIDLAHHITDVQHPELVLKISPLVSAQIPVNVLDPKGSPPQGYEYLDVWPRTLKHTVVGPQEQVQELMNNGVDLILDLSLISKADLDKLKSTKENFHDDEVSFFIPNHWKKISLNLKGGVIEEINDPEIQNLHIDFLRNEYLPLDANVMVTPFYPLSSTEKLNPEKTPLIPDGKIKESNGVIYLSTPLFVPNVSRLYLETIRNNLEIVIMVEEIEDHPQLNWSLQLIDPHTLEEAYVNALIMQNNIGAKNNNPRHSKKREQHLRERFRHFSEHLTLYTAPERRLQIDARLDKKGISVVPSSL